MVGFSFTHKYWNKLGWVPRVKCTSLFDAIIFSITTVSIMTISIMTVSIMTVSIMTVSISTLNITIKNATLSINDTHRNNKINTTLSIRALDTVDSDMLSVIMLNVLNNPIMVSDIIFGGIFPKVVMMGVYFAYSLATKKKVL